MHELLILLPEMSIWLRKMLSCLDVAFVLHKLGQKQGGKYARSA